MAKRAHGRLAAKLRGLLTTLATIAGPSRGTTAKNLRTRRFASLAAASTPDSSAANAGAGGAASGHPPFAPLRGAPWTVADEPPIYTRRCLTLRRARLLDATRLLLSGIVVAIAVVALFVPMMYVTPQVAAVELSDGALCQPEDTPLGDDTTKSSNDIGVATWVEGNMYVGKANGSSYYGRKYGQNNTAYAPESSYAVEAEGLTVVNGKLAIKSVKASWTNWGGNPNNEANKEAYQSSSGFRFGIVGFGAQYRPASGSAALVVGGNSNLELYDDVGNSVNALGYYSWGDNELPPSRSSVTVNTDRSKTYTSGLGNGRGWVNSSTANEPKYSVQIAGTSGNVTNPYGIAIGKYGNADDGAVLTDGYLSVYDKTQNGLSSMTESNPLDNVTMVVNGNTTTQKYSDYGATVSKLSTQLNSIKPNGTYKVLTNSATGYQRDKYDSGKITGTTTGTKGETVSLRNVIKAVFNVNEKVIKFTGDGESAMQVFQIDGSLLTNGSTNGISFAFEKIPADASVVVNVTGSSNITFNNGWRFWWAGENELGSDTVSSWSSDYEIGDGYALASDKTDGSTNNTAAKQTLYTKVAKSIMWNFTDTKQLTIKGGQATGAAVTAQNEAKYPYSNSVWYNSSDFGMKSYSGTASISDDPAAAMLGSIIVADGSFEDHVTTNGRVWVNGDFSMYSPTREYNFGDGVSEGYSASLIDMDQERHNLPWCGSVSSSCAVIAWNKTDTSGSLLGKTSWAVYGNATTLAGDLMADNGYENALVTVTDNDIVSGDWDTDEGQFQIQGLHPNSTYFIYETATNDDGTYTKNNYVYEIDTGDGGDTVYSTITKVYEVSSNGTLTDITENGQTDGAWADSKIGNVQIAKVIDKDGNIVWAETDEDGNGTVPVYGITNISKSSIEWGKKSAYDDCKGDECSALAGSAWYVERTLDGDGEATSSGGSGDGGDDPPNQWVVYDTTVHAESVTQFKWAYSDDTNLDGTMEEYKGEIAVEDTAARQQFELEVGLSAELTAVLSPDKALQEVDWVSDTPGVVSVTEDGVITVHRVLTNDDAVTSVTLKATSRTDEDVYATLQVVPQPSTKQASVTVTIDGTPYTADHDQTITANQLTVNIGTSVSLNATAAPSTVAIAYSSASSATATVSSTGTVTGITAGTTTVKITAGTATITVPIKVVDPNAIDYSKATRIFVYLSSGSPHLRYAFDQTSSSSYWYPEGGSSMYRMTGKCTNQWYYYDIPETYGHTVYFYVGDSNSVSSNLLGTDVKKSFNGSNVRSVNVYITGQGQYTYSETTPSGCTVPTDATSSGTLSNALLVENLPGASSSEDASASPEDTVASSGVTALPTTQLAQTAQTLGAVQTIFAAQSTVFTQAALAAQPALTAQAGYSTSLVDAVADEDGGSPYGGGIVQVDDETTDSETCSVEHYGKCTKLTDYNADPGIFRLKNLENGTYEITEALAPSGYELNPATYTFVVSNGSVNWVTTTRDENNNEVPIENISLIKNGNALMIWISDLPQGVAWSKVEGETVTGSDNAEHVIVNLGDVEKFSNLTRLSGSSWTLYQREDTTDESGNVISSVWNDAPVGTVYDCVSSDNGGSLQEQANCAVRVDVSTLDLNVAEDLEIYNSLIRDADNNNEIVPSQVTKSALLDGDPTAGNFLLKSLSTGTYRIQEADVPDYYDGSASYWEFTIGIAAVGSEDSTVTMTEVIPAGTELADGTVLATDTACTDSETTVYSVPGDDGTQTDYTLHTPSACSTSIGFPSGEDEGATANLIANTRKLGSAEWEKVAAEIETRSKETGEVLDTPVVPATPLEGSVWTLTFTPFSRSDGTATSQTYTIYDCVRDDSGVESYCTIPSDAAATGTEDEDGSYAWPYDADGNLVPSWALDTDERGGYFSLQNLPWGRYVLKEKTAPAGYNLTDRAITFVVGAPTDEQTAAAKAEQTKYEAAVETNKTAATEDEKVPVPDINYFVNAIQTVTGEAGNDTGTRVLIVAIGEIENEPGFILPSSGTDITGQLLVALGLAATVIAMLGMTILSRRID